MAVVTIRPGTFLLVISAFSNIPGIASLPEGVLHFMFITVATTYSRLRGFFREVRDGLLGSACLVSAQTAFLSEYSSVPSICSVWQCCL